MNTGKYFNYPLTRLYDVHDRKLKELHRLQDKDFHTRAIVRRIDTLATQLYYIKQAIAALNSTGRMFP